MILPKEIQRVILGFNRNPKIQLHRELRSLTNRNVRRNYYMEWSVFIDLPNRMLWPCYREKLHLSAWIRKFDWHSNMVFVIKKRDFD